MKTAVEWYNQQIVDRQNGNGDSRSRDEIFEKAKEMENEREKSIFSIAYRMTPIEFGKEYCELEFEKFKKTFKQQEQ
jgi:tyrosyl-tRNA synthetase